MNDDADARLMHLSGGRFVCELDERVEIETENMRIANEKGLEID